jgi:hypothetical protein
MTEAERKKLNRPKKTVYVDKPVFALDDPKNPYQIEYVLRNKWSGVASPTPGPTPQMLSPEEVRKMKGAKSLMENILTVFPNDGLREPIIEDRPITGQEIHEVVQSIKDRYQDPLTRKLMLKQMGIDYSED